MRKNPAAVLRILLLFLMLSACQSNDIFKADDTQMGQGGLQASETGLGISSAIHVLDSVEYEVVEHFQITNHGPGTPSKHNLWAALIQDLPPYQKVEEMSISSKDYRTYNDEFGNLIAEFDLSGLSPGDRLSLDIHYRLKVNRLSYDLSKCEGTLPNVFLSPELYIESNNPQIRALADDLARGKPNLCEQVRSFYNYIGDTLVYTYNGKDWGAQAALGEMGADCSEYSDLMIALSRAAGVPAVYLEGLLYLDPSTEALAKREHAWLEVYLPDIGWAPMDPTLGRALSLRDKYFAANNPDHIIVTRGRNPSALRGGSYYSHIYWPGPSAEIKIEEFGWQISPVK